MSRLINHYLNEPVLGFLALGSLFLLVTPYVFAVSDFAESVITILEYVVVLLFAIEYFASLAEAEDKSKFMANGWRIIDALIIVSAIVATLPVVPDVLRHSPVFRLIRVARFALLGVRSSHALKPVTEDLIVGTHKTSALKVYSLGDNGRSFESITWETGLERIRSTEPAWLFITGVDEVRLVPVADALGVPVKAVQRLFRSARPGFDTLEKFSTFFVRHPIPVQPGERLKRTPVLMVGTAENIVVMSPEDTDLDEKIQQRLIHIDDSSSNIVRATVALVGEILNAYAQVLDGLEYSLSRLENLQAELDDEAFLSRTFELRADILAVRSSLKHLRSMIRDLSSGKINIAEAKPSNRELFSFLADDTGDLYSDIEDLRESLQVLVDLRLNVSSFQMNRVMRLLALLTSLALIPATAGGILGMNLADAPWVATLSQVAFGIAAGMSLSLYIFAIKGWLR